MKCFQIELQWSIHSLFLRITYNKKPLITNLCGIHNCHHCSWWKNLFWNNIFLYLVPNPLLRFVVFFCKCINCGISKTKIKPELFSSFRNIFSFFKLKLSMALYTFISLSTSEIPILLY